MYRIVGVEDSAMLRSLAQAHDSTHDTPFKSFALSALSDLVCRLCRSCVGICVGI